MRTIKQLVFHHSVTDPNNKDIWAESIPSRDYHAGYYIDGKEYAGNYHYMIYQDGEIKHPVNDDWYTFHCGNYAINLTSIAICFIGDYSTTTPSTKALQSANKLLNELKQKYNIENVYGHRELYPTRCPGDWWNLKLIEEAKMALNYEQVRRGYLAILRREPDNGKKNVYVGAEMSEPDFLCELADSKEHTDRYNDSEKYRAGQTGNIVYEKITEELYRKK